MSLGNLSIKVNADIGGFVTNMDYARQAAESGMGGASSAANEFRMTMMQSANQTQIAAAAIGSNMQAANDAMVSSSQEAAQAIVSSADESTAAIEGITQAAANVDTRSMGEKVAFGVGAGVGAGVVAAKNALDAFEDYVKAKLIIVGLAIVTGIAAATFTAVYAAYKVVGAISAMMDGSFFKSDNIDALIASNKELLDLQENLHLSSIEAGALNEAMKRLGVDSSDYKAVYEGVTNAVRDNGEELTRLGVKYKSANGSLLENRKIIENAKAVLDTYTEGWDRNQAAAAMGIGSYAQITSALKVTTAEVQTSKERLDDYQLGMTAGTQEMVTKYQTAMREFDRENDLAAQGFKRVYADAVMPIYTDMANMFKEGWPSIVQATRVGVSTVVGLFYAMADGIYIAKEAIMTTFSVIGNGLGSVAAATVLFLSGDLKGAKDALASGWEDASARIKKSGADIVAQVMSNDKAIRLAVAADGRDASIESAKLPPIQKLKGWTPVPEKPDEVKAAAAGPLDDVAKRVMEGKLKAQEDFISDEKTLLQTREQFLKGYYADDSISASHYYTASQGLIKDNLTVVQAAYDKEIEAIQEYIKVHKTESDKKADIVAAENKITEIRRKKSQEEIATNRDLALSYMALASERTSIANSLLKADATENASYKHRTSVLTAWRDAQLQNAIEGNQLLEKENKRHTDAMYQMQASNDLQALSQAASVGDQMLAILKQGGQEKTALFKALFLVNKAIAVAEILINTEVGAAKALGMGPFGIPMATIIRALGYTSAGIVAGTAIAQASAEGGYDIPAGVNPITQLHQKEMVLPAAQAEVIRGLAKNSSGSDGMKLTIVNNTSAKIGNVVEQRISSSERALIIQEAVGATAAQLGDPNSKTSRAMNRSYNLPRSRA